MISKTHHGAVTAAARLETDEQSARKIAAAFDETFGDGDIAVSLVDNGEEGQGGWTVAIHFSRSGDETAVRRLVQTAAGAAAASALIIEPVAVKDWVRDSLAGLAPVRAGRFVVHGAHDRAAVPVNRIGIEIEAALAFGTGHHGTTRGCLLALDCLVKGLSKTRLIPSPSKGEGQGGGRSTRRPNKPTPTRLAYARRPPPFRGRRFRILDLGTGSGVLAIAAARALRQRVLATDLDGDAVCAARDNARHNGAGPMIDVGQADGISRQRIAARAPFDLVFANILLGPLQRFAAPLRQLIGPGGRIILSGILSSQASAALSAYRPLVLERRIDLDGWTTLVLRRSTLPWRGREG